MKTCAGCKTPKPDDQYSMKKNRSGGYYLAAKCKSCAAAWHRSKRSSYTDEQKRLVRDRQRKYNSGDGRDKRLLSKRKYRLKKAIQRAEETGVFSGLAAKHDSHVKAYYKYKDKVLSMKHDAHVISWRSCVSRYARWKYKHIPKYRTYNLAKKWINKCICQGTSGQKWPGYVGYNHIDLIDRIESTFTSGMTWDNRGEWEIDHIIPAAFFNFDHPADEQFKLCYSLDNLRALWVSDNRAKGSKLLFSL